MLRETMVRLSERLLWQPNILFLSKLGRITPSGMRLSSLRIICFLVMPSLPASNPMESAATVYVGPPIQLSLRL